MDSSSTGSTEKRRTFCQVDRFAAGCLAARGQAILPSRRWEEANLNSTACWWVNSANKALVGLATLEDCASLGRPNLLLLGANWGRPISPRQPKIVPVEACSVSKLCQTANNLQGTLQQNLDEGKRCEADRLQKQEGVCCCHFSFIFSHKFTTLHTDRNAH